MICPLCGKELITRSTFDENTGKEVEFLVCSVSFRRILSLENVSHFFDINHYQLWDNEIAKAEVAYVYPYRIHNILDKGYCEVSNYSDNAYKYCETVVLFKCPIIKITLADMLRKRIKNLVIFS